MKRSIGVLSLIATALSACVLADPPPTLPIVAEGQISVTGEAPATGFIAEWPPSSEGFVIPVSVLDPTQKIYWLAYTDYTGVSASPQPTNDWPVEVDPPADGGIIVVHAAPLAEPGPGCHTLTIVLAYGFKGPNPLPGAVVLNWTYDGSGNQADCTSYDAGGLLDASFPGIVNDASTGDATVSEGGV